MKMSDFKTMLVRHFDLPKKISCIDTAPITLISKFFLRSATAKILFATWPPKSSPFQQFFIEFWEKFGKGNKIEHTKESKLFVNFQLWGDFTVSDQPGGGGNALWGVKIPGPLGANTCQAARASHNNRKGRCGSHRT